MKKTYLVILGVGIAFSYFYFSERGGSSLSENESTLSKYEKVEKISESYQVVSSMPEKKQDKPVEKLWNPMGDAVSSEEIKKWFSNRGNYSFLGPEFLSDYQAYDMETLERLSDSGDIKAMHVMADRVNNFDDLRKILWKAAAYGSTQAIIQLGALNENDEGSLRDKPIEKQKEKILEALSYYELAKIRGDWWGNIVSGKTLVERFQIEITDHDRQLIEERAQDMYVELKKRREQIGLNDFDNSIPDPVMKFYEEMLRPL